MADVKLGKNNFVGVTAVKLDGMTDGVAYFYEAAEHEVQYVVGSPMNAVLSAGDWNGSMYTLYIYLYAAGESGVQIGLPSCTGNPNAQAVIKSALTIQSTYNFAGSETAQPYVRLQIVAIEPPAEDIEIALFGLVPVADTVTVTTSEEGSE